MKKHTKQIVALLMVFAVVLVAGCTEKMTAEQIAARMKAQEGNIKDFSAVVVTTISVDEENTTMRAKIMTKKPDKSRDEFIEPAMIAGKVIIKNGSTEWTYDPVNNQATERTLRENELSGTDYTGLIKGIMNETDISYEGIENVEGRRAYVIVVTPRDETDRHESISKTRAWIDCENWIPLRIEMCGEEDKRNISVKVEYNNITFNTGIPDSEFIFEVPEGVHVVSEIGTPDVAPTSPASEAISGSVMAHPLFANWRYMSYRNLSISNAPALNQAARITYSIIPDRDMEVLYVHVSIPNDGFELMDIDDTWPHTRYNWTSCDNNTATWYPTNLSKDTMYQFNVTIKAIKTGNWTLSPSGSNKGIYISVSEDSAYISDKPFPEPIYYMVPREHKRPPEGWSEEESAKREKEIDRRAEKENIAQDETLVEAPRCTPTRGSVSESRTDTVYTTADLSMSIEAKPPPSPSTISDEMIKESKSATESSVTKIFTEDFEGSFPGSSWTCYDSTPDSGEDYWDDTDQEYLQGGKSAYCADMGDVSGYKYDKNMWDCMQRKYLMDASGWGSAVLSFHTWFDMDNDPDDTLNILVYDGSGWYIIATYSGNSDGWKYKSVKIPAQYLTSQFCIGFLFSSDGDDNTDEGAYIDFASLITPEGYLIVAGDLEFINRELDAEPMEDIRVTLFDHDFSSSRDWLYKYDYTDHGYFEFTSVVNSDDDEGGILDPCVQIETRNPDIAYVLNADGNAYTLYTASYINVPDGIFYTGNPAMIDNSSIYKAWWVFDTLRDAKKYLETTVSYDMPKVDTYWQWDHDADYGTGINTTHWSSGTSQNPGPFIYLDGKTGDDGGSANDPDVIIHEYGHCVMYKVFGDDYPPNDCSQGHYMNGVSEPGCAWTEGWAHFMPLAVFDDKYFTDTTYFPRVFGTDTINLETRNGKLNFPDGDSCEGNVAAALWDIYDDHDEMYDRLSDGFGNIWHVLQEHDQTGNEDTFNDFYDSWCALGHDKPKANSAIFQNDIDYNLPPGVVVANPEPGKVYFGVIHTLTYTTDEDGDVPQMQIWFSRDNIEWHLLDLPLLSDVESDGYSIRGEDEGRYVDWNTTNEIDEDDSVWLRMCATDDLGASSSDDTDGSFIVDNVAPHHWRDFTPTDWVADQIPDCTIEAKDNTAGLDVSAAYYKYSTDGGSSWSGWRSASCTGSDGATSYQTITASAVPFNRDSGTQNKIKFKIDDVAENMGEGGEYTVKIDATDPPAPVISSSTHPDEDEWYTGNDPSFSWTTPSDTSGIDRYSYIFDQSATTTPDTTCEPAGNSRSYTDVADGIWYFHVRAKDNAGNWGGADHYRVKIWSEASTADALIALAIAAGSREYDSRLDVSGDGQVTSLDALMILQAAAGDGA